MTVIELEDDKITLEIPEDPVCGWKMVSMHSLQVSFTVAYYVHCLSGVIYALCTDVH